MQAIWNRTPVQPVCIQTLDAHDTVTVNQDRTGEDYLMIARLTMGKF